MSGITSEIQQKIDGVKTLDDVKTLFNETAEEDRYAMMKHLKFKVMEIMSEEVEKGLLTEGQYLSQCNHLRQIYP